MSKTSREQTASELLRKIALRGRASEHGFDAVSALQNDAELGAAVAEFVTFPRMPVAGIAITRVHAISHHRNGVSGTPFEVVLYDAMLEDDTVARRFVTVSFDDEEGRPSRSNTATFDVEKLAAGDVTFGSNSWRGDQFAAAIANNLNVDSYRRAGQ